MDNQDREFESFLRRFQLRKPAPFLEGTEEASPVKRKTQWWLLAGAGVAAAVILLSVSLVRKPVQPKEPPPAGEVTVVPRNEAEPRIFTGVVPVPDDPGGAAPTGPTAEESGKKPPVLAESRRLEKTSPTSRVVVIPETQQEPAPPPQTPQTSLPAPQPPPEPERPPAPPESREALRKRFEGEAMLVRACGQCHPTNLVESRRYDNRDAYTALVSQQVAYGAALQKDEIPVLVDYLWATYGVKRSR